MGGGRGGWFCGSSLRLGTFCGLECLFLMAFGDPFGVVSCTIRGVRMTWESCSDVDPKWTRTGSSVLYSMRFYLAYMCSCYVYLAIDSSGLFSFK